MAQTGSFYGAVGPNRATWMAENCFSQFFNITNNKQIQVINIPLFLTLYADM